jgi:hypothetical protein
MVSTVVGGVCRLDDTTRVDVPTLRSATTGDEAAQLRRLDLDPGVSSRDYHIDHEDWCAASLSDEESRASGRIPLVANTGCQV